MTNQRANQRALAAARICENLAYALPGYRDDLVDRLRTLTGFGDHTPGAPAPTSTGTRLLSGRCEADMACTECAVDEPVNCGHTRPCPHHDDPVILTRTEGAAAERDRLKAELDDANQVITTITLLANELLGRARRAVPHVKIKLDRCDATGRTGALEWADPTCTNPRSRGPLCDRCSKAEWRWRTAHALGPRPDGVFSQPGAS